MFDFFEYGSKAYAKRSETMLREALFARLEHEAAAEHHQALARMYAERIARLQREALSNPWSMSASAAPTPTPAGEERRVADRRTAQRAGFRVLTKRESEVPQVPRAS
ncbi:MAG: hypothetical protein J7556_11665 [Acidovorax sp.]|nr:hypothetical protein [Acidovorax sp.]